MAENDYLVICEKGHERQVSIDEIEEILDSERCPVCEAPIAELQPSELQVECIECGWEEQGDWKDVMAWLWIECPRCQSNTQTSGDIRIVGSHSHAVGEYQNFCEHADIKKYLRNGRDDYWELVIHYTLRKNFLEIIENQKIKAMPTGYFGTPAVCLTDAPSKFGHEFKHRYGPFGIAFRKRDIISGGGGPAVYLLDNIIKEQKESFGFAPSLLPFLNVLRIPTTAPKHLKAKRVDYLHDREWRYPGDIDFELIEPVGIVLPEGIPADKFRGPDGKKLISIAWRYNEID